MLSVTVCSKKLSRIRRSRRVRCHLKAINATRLLVHRTSRHMYAQIISSNNNKVLVSASTLESSMFVSVKYTGNKQSAILLGKLIAERALNKNIHSVSFDRSGFKYHGRVKALADSARKFGLKF
ncbi:MAG: 50S ribosomal protein L18 [Buchnera aphidicola (Eriosoma harunire)]